MDGSAAVPELISKSNTIFLTVGGWRLMATVTLRIINGAERGLVLDQVATPITIGREEGNTIQLNDDRVSRYHVKIQEDRDQIVLTDLESTNGTKVNGEDTSLRILRFGDVLTIGKSRIIYGSRDEIAGRLAELRGIDVSELPDMDPDELGNAVSLDFELSWSEDDDIQETLHIIEPPELPKNLDAIQSAQLSELVGYLHIRIRRLITASKKTIEVNDDDTDSGKVELGMRQWQNLVDIQSRLADYLRAIKEPDSDG